MISINCSGCRTHCCGKVKELRPIMMPWEEETFQEFCNTIKKPAHNMLVLKRKKNGNCIFLDDKTIKCKIYDERPFECRIYPLLLKFPKKDPTIIVDDRFCKNLKSLKFNQNKVLSEIKKKKFTKEWIDSFNDMTNF